MRRLLRDVNKSEIFRLHRPWYDIEGDRSDGQGCGCQESYRGELCTPDSVKANSLKLNWMMSNITSLPRFPNVYGIDMPSRSELVAHGRDMESIAAEIGADLVVFQTLPDLISCVRQLNPALTEFDCSVFTGEYVTGGVDEDYLQGLERLRADNARGRAAKSSGSDVQQNGVKESQEAPIGCSGPMNGADDTVGLHNSWNVS